MRVLSCIVDDHNLWLVALAAFICVCGGWVSFDLFRRARERTGLQKAGWTFLAAVAMGSAIWCTHFIAILAYEVDAPVLYDPLLTMVSLLVVIIGSGAGLNLALSGSGRWRHVAGGAVVGAAIAGMHYAGMTAFRVDGIMHWDQSHVLASVALSVILGALSIYLFMRTALAHSQAMALAIFTLAVCGLHFTGMSALTVEPFVTAAAQTYSGAAAALAVAIGGVAMIIVGTGIASNIIDNEAELENLSTLRQMALNDTLTGLPNRASFSDYLRHELDRAGEAGSNLAVIGIDLDKFKEINDLRGHDAGDRALKTIAARLNGTLRDGEFVARIGGDEFAAVKRFASQNDLLDFISRLEAKLFEPITIDDFEIATGASIGVSVFPEDGETAERLVSNADLAMYRAKMDVTRASCFYEPQMDEKARARRALALDLRQAIDRKELQLYYQVQTSIVDGSITGYEALLRWNHTTRGRVPPDEFIPVAEETGSILVIGEWVLREACRAAALWPQPHKIAVNLSAVQLLHCDLSQTVHEILLETGLAPERLELEVTESVIISEKQRSLHVLRRIRALGVTIALDDFGTGYSSLETLRSFPFDKIKLDRSFISEVGENAQAKAIVRAVLALGKSLDIAVLAEGVERLDQLDLLRLEGCDEAQGYLLGRPQPDITPVAVRDQRNDAAPHSRLIA